MIVVNLFGAPGAGKSTGAAYIFSRLKMAGVNCELVSEFAKDKVWEDNKTALNNQVKILGEQYYRITRCEDKVDVIVTDSPLINSYYYNKDERLGDSFKNLVFELFNSYENLNFFINRTKPYVESGRLQTEKESNKAGLDIKDILNDFKINFEEYDGDIVEYNKIANYVLEIMKDRNLISQEIADLDPFKNIENCPFVKSECNIDETEQHSTKTIDNEPVSECHQLNDETTNESVTEDVQNNIDVTEPSVDTPKIDENSNNDVVANEELPEDLIYLYTDGACSGNPGLGGYGAILVLGKHEKELSGNEEDTTNNRMELTAVIEGLKALKKPSNVMIVADSKYITDTITLKRVNSWKENGWKLSNKKPAQNVDLWEQYLELAEKHNIFCRWVKAHTADNVSNEQLSRDVEYNKRCDALAVAGYNS